MFPTSRWSSTEISRPTLRRSPISRNCSKRTWCTSGLKYPKFPRWDPGSTHKFCLLIFVENTDLCFNLKYEVQLPHIQFGQGRFYSDSNHSQCLLHLDHTHYLLHHVFLVGLSSVSASCSPLFLVVPFWCFLQMAQCFSSTVTVWESVLGDEPEATGTLRRTCLHFTEKSFSQKKLSDIQNIQCWK